MPDSCIVLLSGGLDSATCLLLARREGLHIHALSFDYGQRHAIELDCARQLAKRYGAESHRVIRLDLAMPSASALTDPSREVPRHALGDTAIPVTYVPARNTLFLAHALAFGEAIGARDSSSAPTLSTTPATPTAVPSSWKPSSGWRTSGRRRASRGARFRVRAPLLALSKAQIVKLRGGARPRFLADDLVLRPCGRWPALRRLRLLSAERKGLPGGGDRRSPGRSIAVSRRPARGKYISYIHSSLPM